LLCLDAFAFLDTALASRCAQDIEQDGKRQQAVEHKGEKRTQQGAAWTGGLGNGHHDDDIHPGNGNQVHIDDSAVRLRRFVYKQLHRSKNDDHFCQNLLAHR